MKNDNKEIMFDEEFNLICDYIKIRNEKKITQQKLSEITGLAQSTIARIEKNLHSASLNTFIKLLDAMDCELKIVKK